MDTTPQTIVTTSSLNVAKIILAQLGAGRFVAMTGAKKFIGSTNSLSFKLPGGGGFALKGINHVKITLEANDTYTIEFTKIRASKSTLIETVSDVYCSELTQVFTRVTGLETQLGNAN